MVSGYQRWQCGCINALAVHHDHGGVPPLAQKVSDPSGVRGPGLSDQWAGK